MITPQLMELFISRLLASHVLPGTPRKITTVVIKHTAVAMTHMSPLMARRLNELCNESGGLVRLGVRKLVEECGAAGGGRHNSLVTICGKLVHMRWTDAQVLAFVVPLVNQHFSTDPDDDWTQEVERALAHARDRDGAKSQNILTKSFPWTSGSTQGAGA